MASVKEKLTGMKDNIVNNPSFTLKEQLGYAGGMFGNCMGQDCVYTYSNKFNRDYQMIEMGNLNLIENVYTILGFFAPPVAGALLDLPTREGKKSMTKRILKITPLPFAISSLLMFIVPSGNPIINMGWAFALYMIFSVVDTFFDMALNTMALRMTANPKDRKNFYTISSLASTLGSMLPGWLLPIVVDRFTDTNSQKWAYFFVALVFGVLGVSTMCAPYFTLNEKVGNLKVHESEKIFWNRYTVAAILRNKPFIVMELAMMFETVRQVTYDLLPDLYRETFDDYGMKAIIDVISGALSYVGLFSVPIVGNKISARTMVMGGHLYSTLFYAAAALLGLNFRMPKGVDMFRFADANYGCERRMTVNLPRVHKYRYVTGVLIGFSGMPNAGMAAGRRILLADSTDYMEWNSEKRYGEPIRSDGMLLAVQSLMGKVNALLRINIRNLSLKAIGYKVGQQDAEGKAVRVVQSDKTLMGIYFVVTLCGVIGNLLPGIIYSLDNFTGKKRDAIMQELNEMRAARAAAWAETSVSEP